MFETYLTIVGRIVTALDKRRLPNGTTVVSFRVASNQRRLDRATETWSDGDSLYLPVNCWKQLGENVHASFVRGDPIIVRGRLRTKEYDDKDGKHRSVIELEGLAVGPDLSRSIAKITRLKWDGSPAASTSKVSASGDNAPDEAVSDDPWGSSGSTAGSDDPWGSEPTGGDAPGYDSPYADDAEAPVEAAVRS